MRPQLQRVLNQAKEEHLNLENVNFKLKISDRGRLSQEIEQNKGKKTNKMSSRTCFRSLKDALFSVGFFIEILVDLGL